MGTIYFRITGEQVTPLEEPHFQGKMKGSKLL